MTQTASQKPILTQGNLTLGPVELTTAELQRSTGFYRQVLGMSVLETAPGTAILGVADRPLLVLREKPGAQPAPRTSPGLYHLAVLLPTRADLGRWLRHVASLGIRIGQADHLVSEAFYLNDPDGHGIEVYRDRPRDQWRWEDGLVSMANETIDVEGLLAEPGAELPFEVLPSGTTLGHVHLRVTDLGATEAFYRGVLGFDVVARWPGALFISVGGYHHHFGLNTWQSQGSATAPENASQLQLVNLHLVDAGDLQRLAERLEHAGITFERADDSVQVRDPAGNALRFRLGGKA